MTFDDLLKQNLPEKITQTFPINQKIDCLSALRINEDGFSWLFTEIKIHLIIITSISEHFILVQTNQRYALPGIWALVRNAASNKVSGNLLHCDQISGISSHVLFILLPCKPVWLTADSILGPLYGVTFSSLNEF